MKQIGLHVSTAVFQGFLNQEKLQPHLPAGVQSHGASLWVTLGEEGGSPPSQR